VRPGPRARPKDAPLVALVLFDRNYDREADAFTALVRGIESGLAANGMGLVLFHAWNRERLPAYLEGSGLKGCLLSGAEPNPSLLGRLQSLPAVWLTSYHDQEGDHALAGNEAIGRLAARYLLDRGHRALAFLNVIHRHPALRVRGEAFQFEAFRKGVPASIYADGEDRHEASIAMPLEGMELRLATLVDQWLASTPRATGLFVPYDPMAALVYRLLRRRGLRPGRDADIVSCNNQRSTLAGLDPRSATIDIGSEAMGRHAVEQLLRRLRHPEDTRSAQVVVEPVLVAGENPWPPGSGLPEGAP
jgi:DNA-binding LacI/PurR family transcriptional regulator